MKLNLTDLEEARADPPAFIAEPRPNRVFSGMSRRRALQYAIYEYHRTDSDLEAARNYLRTMYHRNFKRPDQLWKLEEQLDDYDEAFREQGNLVIETKRNAVIDCGHGLVLTGEVPRLDMVVSGGYAVWVFARAEEDDWKHQLRMPVLQYHYAERLGAPVSEIGVGIYSLESAEYEQVQFSGAEIQRALDEIDVIATALTELEQ